jgi:hypothetical protein
MYIAVAFVCLVTGECDFIINNKVESLTQCELRNARAHEAFDAIKEISAYRTTCVPIPDDQYNA